MGPNAIMLLQLAIEAATQAAKYSASVAKANAEGRDVTDAEVAAARTATVAAIDALAQA